MKKEKQRSDMSNAKLKIVDTKLKEASKSLDALIFEFERLKNAMMENYEYLTSMEEIGSKSSSKKQQIDS